jgi:hypothetical protein
MVTAPQMQQCLSEIGMTFHSLLHCGIVVFFLLGFVGVVRFAGQGSHGSGKRRGWWIAWRTSHLGGAACARGPLVQATSAGPHARHCAGHGRVCPWIGSAAIVGSALVEMWNLLLVDPATRPVNTFLRRYLQLLLFPLLLAWVVM